MSTNKNGNLIFTDTAANFLEETRIIGIILHCVNATDAVLELTNGAITTGPTLFKIEVAAADNYADFDFSARPLCFPNGIGVKTITNAEVTIIIDKNKDKGY